jgi:hypothetical protein
MMRLIEKIMTWLNGVAKEQGVSLGEVNLDFDQIISGTGPSAFTEAILAEMELRKEDPNMKIDWDLFHDMQESKVVGRVLVLTVEAFAAGQGHSDSGNHQARAALVRHHYHASNWPSRHPRFSHPAYGEVEKCNWNDECVKKWDKDVEEFSKLSDEEKNRIIEEKRKEREEAEAKQKAEEEKRKKEQEEAERKKKEEEEANRKKKEAEEESRKKQESEEASKQKIKELADNGKQEGAEKKPEKKPEKKTGWLHFP